MNYATGRNHWLTAVLLTSVVVACGKGNGDANSPDGAGGRSGNGSGGRTGSSGNGDGDGTSGSGDGDGTGGDTPVYMPPVQAGGWSDFKTLLTPSDGSQDLGTPGDYSIVGRDEGSKIVYFDAENGDNDSAAAYYWDGEQIIDSDGNAENAAGVAYGKDPFEPNLDAVKAFRDLDGSLADGSADPRIRLFYHDFGQLAGGYPDWFLFRRGQSHESFKMPFEGGRSPEEPMLVGAYGPKKDGRATIDPQRGGISPFQLGPRNGQAPVYCHLVLTGLDIVGGFSATGMNEIESANPEGEGSSAIIEDCEFTKGDSDKAMRILYPPRQTVIRRTVLGYEWNADDDNQAYYTQGPDVYTTFDEVIFYRNGFKSDPRWNADPVRDKFSRNIYEGGGARMGHVHKGIISADGASGGPQMRFGGLIENSLIIEGYFFSSTDSNSTLNPWTTLQEGQSAVVRNNVQLILDYPSPRDPDPEGSDEAAQYGEGYTVQGSTFGAVVEGNIFSGAMQLEELGGPFPQHGFTIAPWFNTYPDGNDYTIKDVTISKNIIYHTAYGFLLTENWRDVSGVKITENTFVSNVASQVIHDGPSGSDQLVVENNKFYVDEGLPNESWVGNGNETNAQRDAAGEENWSDPDRTLRRYVVEVLNLELLDWGDDPYLDPAQATDRAAKNEEYDPTGLKTFMAVAMRMRNGGSEAIPESGKPDVNGDYPWDARFTGPAVVSWIREGFGLSEVE